MENQNFTIVKGGQHDLPFFLEDLPNLENYAFTWVLSNGDLAGSGISLSKTSGASQIDIDSANREVIVKTTITDFDYASGRNAGARFHELWATFDGTVIRRVASGTITIVESTLYKP